jgi:hypothetical protein
MVEPLRASGSVTLNTDVTDDSVSRIRKYPGELKVLTGKK